MPRNKLDDDVLSVIPRGRENARTVTYLSNLIGINTRTFYNVMHRLCIEGVPVVSSRDNEPRGVYIAVTEAEKTLGVKPYESQHNDMERRIQAIYSINTETWEEDYLNKK